MIVIKARNKVQEFSINSFCSVSTKEVKEETLFLIKCINRLYNVPIIIFCDEISRYYLEQYNIENVKCIDKKLRENTDRLKKNHYHRPDVIGLKMDVLEYAINHHDNSVFVDCDIILLQRIFGPSDCSLALSHNLTENADVAKQSNIDGMFNAGMLWSNSVSFAKWWRNEYESGTSSFYEQAILNRAPAKFRTSYFDLSHNYGFWRGEVGERIISSFHCHLGKRLDSTFVPHMNGRVDKLRKSIIKTLELRYPELYLEYERIFLK